ncbi:hypothetical protein M8C21_008747, partial [Ambrosia artemisiifolia]
VYNVLITPHTPRLYTLSIPLPNISSTITDEIQDRHFVEHLISPFTYPYHKLIIHKSLPLLSSYKI